MWCMNFVVMNMAIKITSYDNFFMINIGKLKKLEFMNGIIYFVSIILKKMDWME